MVNSPVAMENENTFVFSLLTVAAIDAVVWTVVPLAGEHIQAFCNTARSMVDSKRTKEQSSTVKPSLSDT